MIIPNVFKPACKAPYPAHNRTTVEEEVYRRIGDIPGCLPIHWTNYLVSCADYATDDAAMFKLASFVRDCSNATWTVVQYDDGVCVDTPGITVFGAGGVGDVPIPLACEPHPVCNVERDKLITFQGNVNTHLLRRAMINLLGDNIEILPIGGIEYYREILCRSRFVLCPRGYGKTSFRLYEAMQCGAVPIYISDEHWLPYTDVLNWDDFAIIVSPDMIKDIPDIVNSVDCVKMGATARDVWHRYFSWDGISQQITRILNET